jgi:hypothetical protein
MDITPEAKESAVASLLAGLRPNTDLSALVERVHRDNLARVVVLTTSVAAWESRDAAGWAQVSAWLAATGVAVVQIESGQPRRPKEPGATDSPRSAPSTAR